MAQIRVSTTGTLNPVVINDLGALSLPHPSTDVVLWDDATHDPFTLESVRDSLDLQEAIDLGHLTMSDESGNPIDDINTEVGQQAIDGDHLEIDFVPANYTRTLEGVVPTDELEDLTSHLYGIDLELSNIGLGALKTKAGNVLVGAFTGNPKTATVTFSTAFADANYSVSVLPIMNGETNNYVMTVFDKVAGSFKVSLGSNSTSQFLSADWIATKHGEN